MDVSKTLYNSSKYTLDRPEKELFLCLIAKNHHLIAHGTHRDASDLIKVTSTEKKTSRKNGMKKIQRILLECAEITCIY